MSGSGLLMYIGIPYTDLVVGAPFLALGIGVDDMFVMLASWRKTNHYLTMERRLPEAMSHAAMSITITSGNNCRGLYIQLTPFASQLRLS